MPLYKVEITVFTTTNVTVSVSAESEEQALECARGFPNGEYEEIDSERAEVVDVKINDIFLESGEEEDVSA